MASTSRTLWTFAIILLVAQSAPAQKASKVRAIQKAISAYLVAAAEKEKSALAKAVKACDGSLADATAALRTLPPLTKAKKGTKHGLKFQSGGHGWEYSIRLPKGYDNKKRYPVLVLPDHGSVGAKAGISYWEQSKLVDRFILFRPVIIKHQGDKKRFPDQQFFARDAAVAMVMRDALNHLRLHYAVDHDRFVMTGLSQAGYYTWYYAVSFPDQFAGIIPESAGGMAVRAAISRLAKNLTSMNVRILHSKGDKITPFADARLMEAGIKKAGGKVVFVSFDKGDYRSPNRNQHPIPHSQRVQNVLPWALDCKREIPDSISRMIRYKQQGHEGRFRVTPPQKVAQPIELTCWIKKGRLKSNVKGVVYLASPEDILSKRRLKGAGKVAVPKADLQLLLRIFKNCPDPRRLVAAEVRIK